MIYANQMLCAGCEACINACPSGAISMSDGKALVDPALCDGCGSFDETHKLCVEICPNGALMWIAEPTSEGAKESSSLTVVQPPVVVIPAETRAPTPWRRVVLPVVGGALSWMGREVVPRLAPLALDVLDSALARRPGRSVDSRETRLALTNRERGRGGRRRRRRRQRR